MKTKTFLVSIFTFFFLISCNNDPIESALRETSNSINKTCPLTVDQWTTLSNTMTLGKSITYNYLVDSSVFQEFQITQDEWSKQQEIITINLYCTNPDMVFFRDNNIDVSWSYIDFDGNMIDKFTADPSKCN